jgi:alginate O-acetyltransferase complex protein AlgI
MLLSVFINYFFGLKVNKYNDNERIKKNYLIVGVVINLLLLGVFKYTNFIVASINDFLILFNINQLPQTNIRLPIGISFFTFQAMSYLIDVYRRDTLVQRKFSDLALYVSLFPQLIAGPIVRYHDVALQLDNRTVTIEKFKSGVQRFIMGLARKVILANSFAVIATDILSAPSQSLDFVAIWFGLAAYTLQIYYDFSGYSEMAIGLGRMFGFEFLENFNFPYLSKSFKEFWTRWHISLSTWIRDYIFFPLGGSKGSTFKTYRNLIIIFLITGLWHGASWNMVIWGFYHGAFMVIERIFLSKLLSKIPKIFGHIYFMLAFILSWPLFLCNSLNESVELYKSMFGFNHFMSNYINISTYLTIDNIVLFIIAILGSTTFFVRVYNLLKTYYLKLNLNSQLVAKYTFEISSVVFLIMLLLISTLLLLTNTYNPFIYFRF